MDKVGKGTFTSVKELLELGMLMDFSRNELQNFVVEQQEFEREQRQTKART